MTMQQEAVPFDLPLTFGQQFAAARKRTGLDQSQFGEAIGMDRTTISRWERDKQMPDFDVVVRLSAMSGWPLALFARAIEIEDPTAPTGGPISAEPGSPCTRSPLADVLPFRLAS